MSIEKFKNLPDKGGCNKWGFYCNIFDYDGISRIF
jgi:hypothetical protein